MKNLDNIYKESRKKLNGLQHGLQISYDALKAKREITMASNKVNRKSDQKISSHNAINEKRQNVCKLMSVVSSHFSFPPPLGKFLYSFVDSAELT